ncbi:tautomerase PptA [Actinokineospora auranticolor]|uniref:4-oxalocrotonate tautomerase n=1 Tax=Actinokineospora auranticolor TaxID=155976 RepID=A0A2S6GKA1_9PSEU|nr:tautomerase PptA [Actinokineospora auranticolor]PPK65647.1 4-oxalocrotonate tautomerase [Actinokineospora auranticolor]
MPHVNVKHFPAELTEAQTERLSTALTAVIMEAFGCQEKAVSIALEPVGPEVWTERVYGPEITDRAELLIRKPGY